MATKELLAQLEYNWNADDADGAGEHGLLFWPRKTTKKHEKKLLTQLENNWNAEDADGAGDRRYYW